MRNRSVQNPRKQNRRSLFAAIIKLLILLGLLLLALVFLNSLFTEDDNISKTKSNETPVAVIELAEMEIGQIRKTRWDNREVAVLLRQFPEKIDQAVVDDLQEKLHASIDSRIRSQKIDYFVYFNTGDSKNCPLYYAGGVFKDVCSSNRFDEAGRDIKGNRQSYMLGIPPHYFESGSVIFGKWESD